MNVVDRRTSAWLVELVIWLALAGAAYALTFEFADQPGTYVWGPASWPRAIILLLVVGALAQFAVRMRRQEAGREPAAGFAAAWQRSELVKAAGTIVLPLVYVWLLPRVGFYVLTPLFLVAYIALLGERRVRYLAGVPTLVFGLLVLVFTRLFYVALPVGNWPGFYDLNNAFVVLVR